LSSLLPPGTIVSYQLTADPVADFRQGFDPSHWNPVWEDFTCDLLFQSRLNVGGMNLVLFPDVLTGSDSLSVFDPGQSLPKNQDSWE